MSHCCTHTIGEHTANNQGTADGREEDLKASSSRLLGRSLAPLLFGKEVALSRKIYLQLIPEDINNRSSQMMSSPSAQVWSSASMARYLSLNDLCTLSMTCKDGQYSVVTAYSSLAARQLVQALEAKSPVLKAEMKFCNLSTECGSNPASQLRQLWTVVSFLRVRAAIPWRPALAATPGVLQDLTLLFNIPQLPRSLVQPLLRQASAPPNNVVMQCQQLMKAAYNRVAGVEAWVQAQCQLGILTDIPDIFVKICCGNIAQEELVSTISRFLSSLQVISI